MKNKLLTIRKIEDDCLTSSRYEIYIGTDFYMGNLSRQLKELNVAKLIKNGYILN